MLGRDRAEGVDRGGLAGAVRGARQLQGPRLPAPLLGHVRERSGGGAGHAFRSGLLQKRGSHTQSGHHREHPALSRAVGSTLRLAARWMALALPALAGAAASADTIV